MKEKKIKKSKKENKVIEKTIKEESLRNIQKAFEETIEENTFENKEDEVFVLQGIIKGLDNIKNISENKDVETCLSENKDVEVCLNKDVSTCLSENKEVETCLNKDVATCNAESEITRLIVEPEITRIIEELEVKKMMHTGVCIPHNLFKKKVTNLHTIPHPAGY